MARRLVVRLGPQMDFARRPVRWVGGRGDTGQRLENVRDEGYDFWGIKFDEPFSRARESISAAKVK